MTQRRKVAILGGNRIPFARSNKEYSSASNTRRRIRLAA